MIIFPMPSSSSLLLLHHFSSSKQFTLYFHVVLLHRDRGIERYVSRQIDRKTIDMLATPKTQCWDQCKLKKFSSLERMVKMLFCLEIGTTLF